MTLDSLLLSESEARRLYGGGDAAHDFDHVLRVTRLAERIATAEGADVEIVRAAALLHDVPTTAARDAHHLAAADFAMGWLVQGGVDVATAEAVAHCIRAHRFRDTAIIPQTLEARVLYDADKLDSIGAIGVARAFAYAGAHGSRLWTEPVAIVELLPEIPLEQEHTPVHEYVFKLRRLLATLHTPTARRIGELRHNTMVAYFAALDREMEDTWAAENAGTPWPRASQG